MGIFPPVSCEKAGFFRKSGFLGGFEWYVGRVFQGFCAHICGRCIGLVCSCVFFGDSPVAVNVDSSGCFCGEKVYYC